MNKLIIFDFDGTLANSLPDVAFYVSETLVEFGFPSRTEEDVLPVMCYSIEEIFRVMSNTKDIDDTIVTKMVEHYQKITRQHQSPRTRLFDGIDHLLKEIAKRGDVMVVLSNKAQNELEVVFNKFLKDYAFDKAIGLKDGVVAKPDPTEIYKLMQEYGVDKSQTYLVGDGDTDVLAGINAGIKLIAVTYGYRDKDFLINLGAKTFADTPQEVLQLIYE